MKPHQVKPMRNVVLVLPIIEKVSEVIDVIHGKESAAMQRPVYGKVARIGDDVTEVAEGDKILMPVEPGKIQFAFQDGDDRYVFVHRNTISGVVEE